MPTKGHGLLGDLSKNCTSFRYPILAWECIKTNIGMNKQEKIVFIPRDSETEAETQKSKMNTQCKFPIK